MKRIIFSALFFVFSSSCFSLDAWVQCEANGFYYKMYYVSTLGGSTSNPVSKPDRLCISKGYPKAIHWVSANPYKSSCPYAKGADGYCYIDPWDAVGAGTTVSPIDPYNGNDPSSPSCSSGSGYGNQFCRNGYIFKCEGTVSTPGTGAENDSGMTCGAGKCESTGVLCRPTPPSGMCPVGEVAIGDGCICPAGNTYDSSGKCGSIPVAGGGGSTDPGTGGSTGGGTGGSTGGGSTDPGTGGSTGGGTGGDTGGGSTDPGTGGSTGGGTGGSTGGGSGSGSGSGSGDDDGDEDGDEKGTCEVGKVVDPTTCNCPAASPWNADKGLCGTGTDIGSGTGSVPGSGSNPGTGTGNKPGEGSGAGSANGTLLDKWADGRTAGDSVSDFISDVKALPLVQGVSNIASVSLTGSCPSFTFSEPYILKVSYDMTPYFCGGTASYIYAAVGLVVVISAVWSAWWIVFVL